MASADLDASCSQSVSQAGCVTCNSVPSVCARSFSGKRYLTHISLGAVNVVINRYFSSFGFCLLRRPQKSVAGISQQVSPSVAETLSKNTISRNLLRSGLHVARLTFTRKRFL